MLRSGIQSDDGPGCGIGVRLWTTLTGNSLIKVDMRERVYFFKENPASFHRRGAWVFMV